MVASSSVPPCAAGGTRSNTITGAAWIEATRQATSIRPENSATVRVALRPRERDTLPAERAVDECDRGGALADGGGHALHVASADVAHLADPRSAGIEQVRLP